MNLLEKLNKGTALGIFSKTTDSSFVEAMGYSGIDFVILDQEHGPTNLETLHNHIRALKGSNTYPIIRVKNVDAHAISSALDTGAAGVQVPNISNAEQAKNAVNAARFYPNGNRGVCRFVRAANYGEKDRNEYFTESNTSILILQVEGQEGINNLDEILNVAGFDILFIGPYDLSQSLGKPGEINSLEVQDAIQVIINKAKEKNILLGAFCDNKEDLVRLKGLGIVYIAYSVDVNLFLNSLKEMVDC